MYWVLGRHPWNKRVFDEVISKYPGDWRFISSPDELTVETVQQDSPEKLFFMHWSWKVPQEITDNYECIVFHPTQVPYGRGGTPIQHLIEGGFKKTLVSAIRMTDEIDAGPVYCQHDMALYGTAEEIYVRMSYIVAKIIYNILYHSITPQEQSGTVVNFIRRVPAQSEIRWIVDLEDMYDFIRMLDAEGYPKAFLVAGKYRYEFDHALLYDNRIEAHVTITKVKQDES